MLSSWSDIETVSVQVDSVSSSENWGFVPWTDKNPIVKQICDADIEINRQPSFNLKILTNLVRGEVFSEKYLDFSLC